MHNYREIEQTYGVEIKRKLRHFEKTSRKVGRYTSHLHFNLQCKHNDVVPRHAKIQGKWIDEEERRIIQRTEKALLNKKIRDVAKKREELKVNQVKLQEELKAKLNDQTYEDIIKVNLERQKKEEEKYSKMRNSGICRKIYSIVKICSY